MKIAIIYIIMLLATASWAQVYKISQDLQLKKLSPNSYLYTVWTEMGSWGRVPSNGLILIQKRQAFLLNTPVTDELTELLIKWVDEHFNVKIIGFVPNHWHQDCVGGLGWLNRNGIKSYTTFRTNEILKTKGLPQAAECFNDSLIVHLRKLPIKCFYLGGGHTVDNIVVWIPTEKILFGGCMLKENQSNSLGNVADASPLQEWSSTIRKVQMKFPEAKIVIPGHGEVGGREILEHTLELLKKSIKTE